VENQTHPQVSPPAAPSPNSVYPVVLLLAVVLFGVGIYLTVGLSGANQSVHLAGAALIAAGAVALVAGLVTWPIATTLKSSGDDSKSKQAELLATLDDRLQQVSVMLNMLSEQQLISDRAKSVAFREKDRDAVRRAIREEMIRKDWEAALVLCNDMEQSFGYKQEAEVFRQEIMQNRDTVVRKDINDALAVIDKHCKAEMWLDAVREGESLMVKFPGVEQLRQLPREIEQRRLNHKKAMLDSWNEAVIRHDVDGSIAILKKLDLYLTPSEAESMQETARGVFKEKLNNLRTQFTLAVQDHKWTDAARIGETITKDFPNTKLAEEVKAKLETLRGRAHTDKPAAAAV